MERGKKSETLSNVLMILKSQTEGKNNVPNINDILLFDLISLTTQLGGTEEESFYLFIYTHL